MKAITIKQPWASLIVHGIKDIAIISKICQDLSARKIPYF